jgi:hypothetical protein
MGMRPKNIELHIEELVLEGFEQVDRCRIAEAVESELTYLLKERGIPPSLAGGGDINRIDGGTFQVESNSRPETVGTRVAQAVYGGLKK